ncbi:MAG: polysaccharide biosynthesis tyrosine autokinase [Thermomicrobiales bacterium]|nr:polysaccharide biosynthesis tyrosine autokinase [Thermomicrobiales bacterium]
MDVDLRQLISVIRRRFWILMLLPMMAALVAYSVSARESPKDAATAVVRVSPISTTGSADYYAILTGQSLIETYRQLITSRPVMDAVIQQLALDDSVEDLQGKIVATAVEGTQLVRIAATDYEPDNAAAVANTVVAVFQSYVAEQATIGSESIREAFDRQIGATKQQIDETARQIQQLESIAAPTAADETQLTILRTQLEQFEDTYAELVSSSQTMVLNSAAGQVQVSLTEPAVAPTEPFAPRIAFRTALGLIAGLLIAGATVFAVEYLDDTVTANSALASLVGAPLLATIDRMPKVRKGRRQLFSIEHPRSSGIESIRFLRTNLQYVAREQGLRSFAFASPMSAEGKSTIVANLAVVMAQVGFPVVVIDADMWHSSQHTLFQTRNDVGLSTLLARSERNWSSVALTVGIPNLRLIPSGPLPSDPSDLLGRDLRGIVEDVIAAGYVVLIDTPPILVGSDTLIVAGCVDGIVMVCRDRQTRRYALSRAIAVLKPTGAKILGAVVNQQVTGGRMDRVDYAARNRRVTSAEQASFAAPAAAFVPGPLTHRDSKHS